MARRSPGWTTRSWKIFCGPSSRRPAPSPTSPPRNNHPPGAGARCAGRGAREEPGTTHRTPHTAHRTPRTAHLVLGGFRALAAGGGERGEVLFEGPGKSVPPGHIGDEVEVVRPGGRDGRFQGFQPGAAG